MFDPLIDPLYSTSNDIIESSNNEFKISTPPYESPNNCAPADNDRFVLDRMERFNVELKTDRYVTLMARSGSVSMGVDVTSVTSKGVQLVILLYSNMIGGAEMGVASD